MDYVIAIGINRYKHHWLDALNYCVDDAKSIAEAFDKLLNSNVQVTVLCDEEATFDQIIKCKDAVVFTPDDRLFIFFAGHGKNIEGEPRLLCFDTTEKDVNERKNCIGVTDFIEEVTSKGTDLYFFADACESAIAPRFFSGYSDSARRGIKSKSDEHNCIIGSRGGVAYFSSVDYSESAQEVAPVGHGIWTDALLKALTTDVAYDRGVLTASSLQEYLNSVVKQYIREEGIENIQTPQFLMQSSLEMVLHKDHNQSLVTSNDIPVNYDSYVDIDNYIPRTVRLYKNQEFEEKLDLYSAVKRHKKIVLISNAGSGKTTETRRLAFLLKNDISSDIPVLIKLCRWEGESIERLVERALPGKLGDNHVLIMDGYDEINESNMLDFSHRVKTFIKSHPQIKVVISVRSNRYCIAEKKGEETFSDFSEYLLTDIPDSEIKEFVRRQGINVNEFMQELRIRNLFSMAGNPFYLLGLVNLFKENSKLPQPLDVMGSFILRQLNVDVGRYTDVEDGFDQSLVMHTMMRLAFAMQCRQQVEIDFVRYKEITEDNNQKLVKKTGLIQRNINKWSFVHKNFQEYLAAKYISVFDMATIKRLVTLDPLQQQIGYAWENVLSFLVLLKSSDELIDWLIEVYPECLVQYEVDFKSEALNARVVKGVFEQCEKNNYWLSMIVRTPNAMDSLCSNVSVIDYLLYKIKSRYPNKYRSLANALHLLKRAKDFHGRNNDVRELMFICISDESVRNYEKGIAIEVLGNKNLGLDTDFSMIVSALGGSVDPELRRSLLTFISETKTNEESIQYVLQSCEEINRSEDFWSCSIVLRNCFIAMEDMSAVKTVINYICDNKGLHMSSSLLDEIYGVLFSRAAQFFRNGDRSISDQLLTFYVGCKYWSDRHLHSRITAYIRETGQSRKVFQYCIEHSVPNPLGSLKPILDNELIDEFADRYSRHMLIQPKMFENYVYSLNETCYRYDDLCRCVKAVSGFEIPKRAEDGTLIKTRNAEKRFYDALFEKSSLEILIEELAQCYEDQNIKIGDMELTSSVQDRRDLELLYYMVRRYGDVFKNMTVADLLVCPPTDLSYCPPADQTSVRFHL